VLISQLTVKVFPNLKKASYASDIVSLSVIIFFDSILLFLPRYDVFDKYALVKYVAFLLTRLGAWACVRREGGYQPNNQSELIEERGGVRYQTRIAPHDLSSGKKWTVRQGQIIWLECAGEVSLVQCIPCIFRQGYTCLFCLLGHTRLFSGLLFDCPTELVLQTYPNSRHTNPLRSFVCKGGKCLQQRCQNVFILEHLSASETPGLR